MRKVWARNKFTISRIQPNIPSVLYLGHEKDKPLEIFPVPSDSTFPESGGYFPYSTRSFIRQASRELGGCSYIWDAHGHTLGGEPVFVDKCQTQNDGTQRCRIFSGSFLLEQPCQLWDQIANLCQTDHEKNFLRYYLSLVKGRNFPMLIPQPRIGPAERIRPDFVLFAPLQKLNYRWYAIELDGGHATDVLTVVAKDYQRNLDLKMHGYTVLSLRPGELGYYREAQALVELVVRDMQTAERHLEMVAVEREVNSHQSAF